MYIQITTRCNMSCVHCHAQCGPNGTDMSMETFKTCLALCEGDNERWITIGGGEPTLHPQFWEMLCLAIAATDNVFIVTNGSITKTALRLAQLAKRGVIGCALSQDYYHDPIDDEVVEAFQRPDRDKHGMCSYGRNYDTNDRRQIRDVLVDGDEGLALFRDPEDGGSEENCFGGGVNISPDGKVTACGCRTAPVIGHVSTFDLYEHENAREDPYGCYRYEEQAQNEMEYEA